MAYLYKHIRKDTNEVFYVGIGSDSDYSRAYTKHKRNRFWKSVVNKTDYDVIIVEDNKSWVEVTEREKYWISFYGRKNLGEGTLVNLTDVVMVHMVVFYLRRQRKRLEINLNLRFMMMSIVKK
jgi:hypothetical protein